MLRSSIVILILKLFAAVTSFGLNIILVRILGVDNSGTFFYFQSLLMSLVVVTTIGLQTPIVRCVAQNMTGNRKGIGILRGAFFSAIIMGPIVSIVLIFLQNMMQVFPFSNGILYTFIITLIFYSMSVILFSYSQGKGYYIVSVLFQSLFSNVIVLIAVVTLRLNIDRVIEIYCFSMLLSVVTQLIVINHHDPNFLEKFIKDSYDYKYLISISIPCFILVSIERMVPLINHTILGNQLGTDAIAEFSVLIKIVGVVAILISAINVVIARNIAIAYKNNELEKIQEITSKCLKVFILVSVIFVSIVIIFGEYVLAVFDGSFVGLKTALIICSVGQVINILTGSVSQLLLMTGNEIQMRNSVLVGFLLFLLCLMIFLNEFSVVKASVCFLVYMSSSNLYAWYMVRKKIGINTLRLV